MVREFSLMFLGFLILFFSDVNAGDHSILIEDYNKSYNPAPHTSYLLDHENHLKIHEILLPEYQEKFTNDQKKILNFGLNTSTLWLKIVIKNNLDESPFLCIENPAIDSIEYFLYKNNGLLVHQSVERGKVNVNPKSVKAGSQYIDLQLESNETYICYFKINSHTAQLNLPMSISSLEHHYDMDSYKNLWNGFFYGLILFLFIYNIFLFFSIHDKNYLYYAFFILSVGFHFAMMKGFGFEHLWINYQSYTHLSPVVGSIAMISCAVFTLHFFKSSTRTPIIHILMQIIIAFYVGISILKFAGYQALSMKLLHINVAIAIVLKVALAIVAWVEGFKASKYYLFGWSFFVVGFTLLILRDTGVIETTIYNKHILQFTAMISILSIAFAISKKINIYIERQNEAQKLALSAAIENEKLISNQNQLLEDKVNQRTIDLEQSISTLSKQRHDLHEANTFKDKVLSIISHDLKSPLSSLTGMLKLMKLSSITEMERDQVVSNLETALNNTYNLLDNILDWADKHQKNPHEIIAIELNATVKEIFELFTYQAGIKKIRLNNQIVQGYFVNTNKNMIELVLRNLVSNAIKFTPKNGTITISIQEKFQDLHINVTDTGLGMSRETMENLFRTDVHRTTLGTENEKGTGLGLKLCKEFVDKFNGELLVNSKLDTGSTFTVKLKNVISTFESVVHYN